MIATVIISIITILGIVVVSLVKPSIKIKSFSLSLYWVIALLGAAIILCSNLLSFQEFGKGLVSNDGINPIQILILFLSMSLISIFLDELGFFSHVALWVLHHSKDHQKRIFFAFYALVAVLTMFTSNDIIILTLTPFIIFFCKEGKISPIPYLVSEFVAANTWSMMFVIGNPTNIYLASKYGIDFISYFKIMAIPTLCAGLLELLILYLLFRKKLNEPILHSETLLPKENIPLTVMGLVVLGGCTVLLIISSYVNLPMYLIAAVSLGVLAFSALIYSAIKKRAPKELISSFKRTPFELIPFLISMFAIALALDKYQVTAKIAEFFGSNQTVFVYGYSSFLSANLLNNIPMSVIYSSICSNLSGNAQLGAVYSSIAGSNVGAFLTPIGALAGIMWMGILKKHEVGFSFLDFIKYGSTIAIPTITICLLTIFAFIH